MSKSGITIEASNEGIARRELGGNLAGKSILRQVVILAFWPLLEQMLGFCVGMTDSVLAGRLGVGDESIRVAALDALALCGYITWLMMILQGAAATGGLAMISRATGAGNQTLANRSLGQALLLGCAAGGIACVALLVSMQPLIRVFGLEPMAASLASDYLSIVALSAPFSGVLFACNAALRGSGDTRTPFIVMTLVNVVNIGMSWLFVFGPAPFGGHGISGIAWGTFIGWVIGALLVVTTLFFSRKPFRLTLSALQPDGKVIKRIIRVGLPSAVEIFGMWTINAFMLAMIGKLPVQGVLGAHFIAIRCESLSFLPGFAFGAAAATLAGQYLGMGDYERARQAVRVCWFAGTGFMTLIGGIFLLAPEAMVNLIAPDSQLHLRLASPIVFLCGMTQPLLGTCIILKTTYRGIGDTKAVMMYSYVSMSIFRLAGVWMAVTWWNATLWWLWIIMAADLLTQALIFSRRFYSGRWMNAQV